MKEIKPCPFCGTDAELIFIKGVYGVCCNNENDCAASVGDFPTEEDAINAWNRRV